MTTDNFAILVTPCIFKPQNDNSLKEILETKNLINVSKLMFNFTNSIFE